MSSYVGELIGQRSYQNFFILLTITGRLITIIIIIIVIIISDDKTRRCCHRHHNYEDESRRPHDGISAVIHETKRNELSKQSNVKLIIEKLPL